MNEIKRADVATEAVGAPAPTANSNRLPQSQIEIEPAGQERPPIGQGPITTHGGAIKVIFVVFILTTAVLAITIALKKYGAKTSNRKKGNVS